MFHGEAIDSLPINLTRSSAAASNQIDTDEDTPPNFIRGASTASVASSATHGLGLDGGGAGSVAGSVHLRTPPNSFVDPTAFKQAFEKHHRDMRRQFEGSSEAGSAPSEEGSMKSLQQALKMMQQAEKKTADSSSKAPTTEEEFDKVRLFIVIYLHGLQWPMVNLSFRCLRACGWAPPEAIPYTTTTSFR